MIRKSNFIVHDVPCEVDGCTEAVTLVNPRTNPMCARHKKERYNAWHKQYYRDHIAEAREYSRKNQGQHRSTVKRQGNYALKIATERPKRREVLMRFDIQNMPPEKAGKYITKIINGEIGYTG
jgi:hypothetical protein